MFALITSVDEAILALVMQFNKHAHSAPLASPKGAELPVFVSGQGQEGVSSVHQVTGQQGVRVNQGRQSVDHRSRVKVDHKEHLFVLLHGCIQFLGQIICYVWHPWLFLICSAHAALVFVGLFVVLFLCVFAVPWCSLEERE